MEILNTATDWAKDESFSSTFFLIFGLIFLLASLGFYQLGETKIANAFIIPTLVAGVLLVILGGGLVYANQVRIGEFPIAFQADAMAFVTSEFDRIEKIGQGYERIIYLFIPLIIIACAALLIFVDGPIWRASLITTIAFMIIIAIVDSNAAARGDIYLDALAEAKKAG